MLNPDLLDTSDVFNISSSITEGDKEVIREIKEKAQELYRKLSYLSNNEMSLAKVRLEECVMWASKGVVESSKRTSSDK